MKCQSWFLLGRHALSPFAISVALLLGATTADAAEGPRVDAESVPLPAGALARLGSTRFWHASQVQHLHFAPDGRILLCDTFWGQDAVYAWDAATGRLRWRYQFNKPRKQVAVPFLVGRGAHYFAPTDFAFVGEDVGFLWSTGVESCAVVRLRLATGEEVSRVHLAPPAPMSWYRFSRDGSRVAVSDLRSVAAYDAATGQRLFGAQLVHKICPRDGIDFSPDGRFLAVADEQPHVTLFRCDNGEAVWKVPLERPARQVRFADANTLVIHPGAFPVIVLNPATGVIRAQFELENAEFLGSTLTPDGRQLLTGCRIHFNDRGPAVCVVSWDLATGKELSRFAYSGESYLAVSPDGRTLVLAGGQAVDFYDLNSRTWLPHCADPLSGYHDIRQRPDGRWVGLGDQIDTFDDAGRRLSRVRPSADYLPWYGRLTPDGTRFIRLSSLAQRMGAPDLEIWDTRAPAVADLSGPSGGRRPVDRSTVSGVAMQPWIERISPDSQVVYTRPKLQAWSAHNRQPLELPPGLRTDGIPEAFSPDGRWVAMFEMRLTAPNHNAPPLLHVVETATGRAAAQLKDFRINSAAVAFSPDGRLLAVACTSVNAPVTVVPPLVGLFDAASGRKRGWLGEPGEQVFRLAFTPDGRSLLTAGHHGTTRVWEIATLGPRRAFPSGLQHLQSVACSRDGKTVATTGVDAPAYLWDVYGHRTHTGPKPSALAHASAWTELASPDAAVRFRAIRTLLASPDETVRLLRARLPSDADAEFAELPKLLAGLTDGEFATREACTRKLKEFAGLAEPALRKAFAEAETFEAKKRLETVLACGPKATGRLLRVFRGVEVLEVLGTEEARATLHELARGPAERRLTAEAQAALARLAQ